jgi:hypothetical protein
VKLSDLIFDKKLYPRVEVNWVTVVSYTDAMRAGEKFPHIEVVQQGDKWLVVDGWHRSHAAKAAHLETIEAVVIEAPSDRDQFLRAVETNLRHGRHLSPYERACIAQRLCSAEFKWSQSKIAGFLHMTKDSLKRMLRKRATTPAAGAWLGKIHKAPLQHLVAQGEVSSEAEEAESILAVKNQQHLFSQALVVLESGIVDLGDPKLCAILDQLAGWFRENRPRVRAGMEKAA